MGGPNPFLDDQISQLIGRWLTRIGGSCRSVIRPINVISLVAGGRFHHRRVWSERRTANVSSWWPQRRWTHAHALRCARMWAAQHLVCHLTCQRCELVYEQTHWVKTNIHPPTQLPWGAHPHYPMHQQLKQHKQEMSSKRRLVITWLVENSSISQDK